MKCFSCGGEGAISYRTTVEVCCNSPRENGDCCGNPYPQEVEQSAPCPGCQGPIDQRAQHIADYFKYDALGAIDYVLAFRDGVPLRDIPEEDEIPF